MSDETVTQGLRGKYSAFALQDSAGVSHLRSLKSAGLTHVHLLPSYDYGSVPEREEDQAVIKVCTPVPVSICKSVVSEGGSGATSLAGVASM